MSRCLKSAVGRSPGGIPGGAEGTGEVGERERRETEDAEEG